MIGIWIALTASTLVAQVMWFFRILEWRKLAERGDL